MSLVTEGAQGWPSFDSFRSQQLSTLTEQEEKQTRAFPLLKTAPVTNCPSSHSSSTTINIPVCHLPGALEDVLDAAGSFFLMSKNTLLQLSSKVSSDVAASRLTET